MTSPTVDDDLPDVTPPDERLAAIRSAKAERARVRAELQQARAYGIARRHANKIRRNRNRQENDPS